MNQKSKIEIAVLVFLLLLALTTWYFSAHPEVGAADLHSAVFAEYKPMAVENPRIHWDYLAEAKDTDYKTNNRNIFTLQLPIPEPLPFHTPEPAPTENTPPPPPPPPPPPKLPLKFFGYGTVEAGVGRRAFLTDGDSIFIVAEGDTVLGRYRVVKIGQVSLEFEELSTGRRASSPIEEQSQPN